MTTREEIERLKAEVRRKEKELEQERNMESLQETAEELEEIISRAETMKDTAETAHRGIEEGIEVDRDEAYYCQLCSEFVRIPSKSRQIKSYHEHEICFECHQECLFRKVALEVRREVGVLVVVDYGVAAEETHSKQSNTTLGVIEDLTFQGENGVCYEIANHDTDSLTLREQ
jgi:SAM-dependent MidA family methyltransferase